MGEIGAMEKLRRWMHKFFIFNHILVFSFLFVQSNPLHSVATFPGQTGTGWGSGV